MFRPFSTHFAAVSRSCSLSLMSAPIDYNATELYALSCLLKLSFDVHRRFHCSTFIAISSGGYNLTLSRDQWM